MSTERRKCLVTLGLSEGATEDDIKKAYRKMALLYHPDKNGSEDAKGKFQEIGYAYKYLTEGPSAFETTNPHDVREELLRRMFEEMFFAQFHGPFAFFCEDSDEDDYYIYHDSSDDDYNASYGTHDAYGHTRTFQNTYASQTPLHQNYPQVSKKQIRKREKRQRQKERAKEKKEQGRKEKREAKNVYTDDINSEQKQREQKTEPAARDNHDKQNAGKSDSGNSRPDTPVLNQQPQKSNKKQKKKIESEQRKREKEMEEIAAELKKKHEREMEKQKEKERLAAQKREEGKENEINFSHFFDTGKKTRKARQREKKRQESGIGATQRDNSGSSVQSERPDKPLHLVNTNTNSTSSTKAKEKTGVSINKTQERNRMPTKPAKPGNRFVILDEIDDDLIRPLSRTSISSNDSMNDSHKNEDGFHEGRYSSRSQTNGTVKSFSFRNTSMNQNNSNSNLCTDFSNTETIRERDMKGNEGFARQGNRINQNGKNMQDNFKGRSVRQPFSRSSSYEPNGFNAFEGEKERQFVQDWSVGVDDDEDNISDNWSNYGPTQFTNDQTGAPYGYGTNPVPGKFGNGYNGWNEARGGSHQPRGHQKKKEFVPRTRGNHGRSDSGSYFHGPQNGIPPYGRGYAPFTRGGEGMFHHQPPHFRGGYHGMPPFRGRNGGYSGPRYGPPVGMPGNYYRHPFDSPMHNGFFYGREGNFNSDMNRNTNWRGNNRKQFNPTKSFNSNFTQKLDSTKKERNQNDLQSNTAKSNDTPSASGSRESSPQFMSWQNIKDSDKNGQLTENMLSNFGNNQASSSGSLDSLDDIVNYEANRASDNQNVMNGTSAASASRSFPDVGVDMGMSEFLSKDSLGVPSGMFTDNIKNYYR